MLCHWQFVNNSEHKPKKRRREKIIIETKKGNIGHKATDCHIVHTTVAVWWWRLRQQFRKKNNKIHPVKMCAHTLTNTHTQARTRSLNGEKSSPITHTLNIARTYDPLNNKLAAVFLLNFVTAWIVEMLKKNYASLMRMLVPI